MRNFKADPTKRISMSIFILQTVILCILATIDGLVTSKERCKLKNLKGIEEDSRLYIEKTYCLGICLRNKRSHCKYF
mgnify:CR=1 FL=1